MNEVILSPSEQSKLKKLHKATKEKQIADRIKCILLLSIGYTQSQVAEILLIDEGSVFQYKKHFTEEEDFNG